AVVGTFAPFPVELAISGRRIELDVLLDLQKRFKLPVPVQVWATGTITVKTELAPKQPVEPEAWIELTELRATVTHRSADGRLTPLTLSVFDDSNGQRPAMSLRATPSSIELACKDPAAKGGRFECPTFVATPAGILELRGSASPKRLSLAAFGDLDLRQLAPLFDATFEDLRGIAALTASVSGTYDKPNYEAALELKGVAAQPVGGDTILEAPSGLIKLANGSLGFTDVKVQVRDQHRDEAGELHIKGNITFDGLTPVGWGVLIDGKVAGKMLLVAVPDLVSQASGLARIQGDLLLHGKGPRPTISGTIDFSPLPVCPAGAERLPDGAECRQASEQHRPLAVIPRGVRRELTFGSGSVDIDTESVGERRTYKITLDQITTSIDGEGTLSGIDGRIELRDGVLTGLAVRLDADDIPFRVPGSLDLILTGRNITFDKSGEHSTLEVGGTVTIIDGTYNRNFTITDQLVSLGSSGPPTKPFWEEYPMIGNANLDLALEVRRFAVRNNIAQIELGGRLAISNTPRDPRLAGRISVTRGRFRIPGTRASFEQTSGSIDFAQNERAGNPELNIASDAQYRDLSGQDHLITLALTGTLTQLQWDLKTSTGYNKSQTLSLLVLGRNPEQLRRSLGDQSLGSDPTRVDPTTNPSQGFADQIVKDLAGDWVSGLLGDSLGKITGLDVLRIEIGFGSIGFHVEKKILENMRLLGDTEQTIRGSTVNARAEINTPFRPLGAGDAVRFQGGYLNKNFNDPAEQDIEDWSLKLVYRFFLFTP
ncbi:MAG: translocation/assembly module TamB domain-containing protein, partial [Deltaproteobacteria bacterium]|nr:translocation/assembly module TamB domain-containing protein [Deltaproteobacteria bacterium]